MRHEWHFAQYHLSLRENCGHCIHMRKYVRLFFWQVSV